jgi:multiple sugar transport system permease protein
MLLRRTARRLGFAVVVVLIVGLSLLPFLWFFITSLKTPIQIAASPPELLPDFSLEFYRSALQEYSLLRYVKNSAVVAGSATAINITLASLAGYALSRIRLRFRRSILAAILGMSMFPQIAIVGPVWRIEQQLGWLNSYLGLIFPYVTLTLPLGIWILASFFRELPADLEDAAKIDGAGPLRTLVSIFLPLSAPGVFTAAILVFIYAWNEFFFALLIMTRPDRQTLPVGIALFQGEYTIPWGEIAAASVIATLPLVLLVLIFQRRIVRGLSAGAVKG